MEMDPPRGRGATRDVAQPYIYIYFYNKICNSPLHSMQMAPSACIGAGWAGAWMV